MQIDELILYNHDGEARSVPLNAGRLNIITGDSMTGKSSIINILRFLLGSGNPHAPHGPIQQSVAWYGLRGHVEQTPFFIGRPAPAPNTDTNETMLAIGESAAPEFEDLLLKHLLGRAARIPRRPARYRGQPQHPDAGPNAPRALRLVRTFAVLLLSGPRRDR